MEHKVTRTMAFIPFLIMTAATIPLSCAYDWSPDMRLTWNIAIDWSPSIAQANDGNVWLAWHSYRTGNADLFYKIHDSSKVHPWFSETRLTTDTNNDISPSLMQAKDGKIWIAWSTNRDGNYEIYYKTSSNSGATWSQEKNVTENPNVDERPSIMQAANDTIYLAWSTNRTGNYEIYYKTSSNSGATWSQEKNLSNDSNADDRDPSVMQAGNEDIWVVWVRNDGGNYNIVYKTYYYSYLLQRRVWSGTISVTQDSDIYNSNPSVMQAKDGKIWIAWNSDKVGEQDDIYYRIMDGTTPTRLTDDLADDVMPSIMQAKDGTIWIVWISLRTDCDIYYRTTRIPLSHDVATLSVIPTETTVNTGETVSIEVVAQNLGTNPEYFTVIFYANSTLVEESTTVFLSPGQLYPMTFTWTASSSGTYKIWAQVSVVNEEIYILDNFFPALLGDVNGDRAVNDSDISALSNAYGSQPGDSNWIPNCNFEVDNKVDAYDLFDLGKNYGKSR